jgi:hypothetical protein
MGGDMVVLAWEHMLLARSHGARRAFSFFSSEFKCNQSSSHNIRPCNTVSLLVSVKNKEVEGGGGGAGKKEKDKEREKLESIKINLKDDSFLANP